MKTKLIWLLVAAAGLAAAQSGGSPAAKPAPRQKIRVSPGIAKSNVLQKVKPDAADLKSLKSADVKINFEIDETGAVESAVGTEGDPALYDRCIKAIQEWRFKPFLLNGQPFMVESYVYFHFKKGKASILFHH